ncbi:peptidase domain-containing ABC transporter [Streptomyces sp. TG1A-8]|uniref:peptidase domain-containing ABC transporter n=1 Tax=Streptomyces sp. TG1A-8 TaxID=3051385 RepID=UPI00265B9EF5|nr:peptidase domain-containing ABC transporter [Streptomyces sp. TG1A-8]MDO0925022.1 peptidase domain-containing ABC transporter [Streptomyces sp. TG1A-8]
MRLQAQVSDCGAACLAMVFALHGKNVPLADLRAATATGRDGVSARRLLQVARTYGFHGRGLRVPLQRIADLSAGTILFWNFDHFVVLESVRGRWVHLVDPQHGRRRVSLETFGESFTGVALQIVPPLPDVAGRAARTRRSSVSDTPWRYLRLFLPRTRRWTSFALCSLLLLGFNLATPLATKYVVERVSPGRSLQGAGYIGFGLLMLTGLFFVLYTIRFLSFLLIQTKVDERVTLGILDRLFTLPYEFFASRSPGDLQQRIRTSSAVRQVLSVSAFTSVFDGVLILSYMTLLLLADRLLALLVISVALAQVAILVLSWRRQAHASVDALEAQSRAEAELAELLEGMPTLKSAGVEEVAGQRWSHLLTQELNTRLHSRRQLALSSGLSAALQVAAPLLVLTVGSVRISHGEMSQGEVLAFGVLAMGLLVPLSNLVQVCLQVSGLGASLARLGDIMEAQQERTGNRPLPSVSGELAVDQVSFAYQGGHPVLHEVSFTVPRGGFTVLLGASGSGKSSCALLLAGLHTPTSGRVLVDGHDLATVDTMAYRRSISFVTQDARLFTGTIRENIAWGAPDVTEEAVVEAAKTAGIHADVTAMPMGYDTLLTSGGRGLSGGQRQRVILARALVRQPRLLILDEATSALDPMAEQAVFQRLTALDCTLVVVAHRLTAVQDADQVIVLERGRVVQQGRHDELLTVEGPYRALVNQ